MNLAKRSKRIILKTLFCDFYLYISCKHWKGFRLPCTSFNILIVPLFGHSITILIPFNHFFQRHQTDTKINLFHSTKKNNKLNKIIHFNCILIFVNAFVNQQWMFLEGRFQNMVIVLNSIKISLLYAGYCSVLLRRIHSKEYKLIVKIKI